MKSVDDRLAQEDHILREIRSTLSTFRTMGLATPRRKGAVYASSPITTGRRLYSASRLAGLTPEVFRHDYPAKFQEAAMQPNLRDGARFGEHLRNDGWPLVIVPGEFFAKNWAQEHYMSLWRQVILRYARTVAFNGGWCWSTGCAEEFLIAVQSRKRILDMNGKPMDIRTAADQIRKAVDEVNSWGFDTKPLYDLWRQIILTYEAMS
jgi:hypothetical protein